MRFAGVARLTALAILWGSNFLWIKFALEGFSPVQITLLRLVLGALTLYAILRFQGLTLPTGRAIWGHFVVAALVVNALPYWLFAYGEQHVPSGLAGAINATTPLWTIAVALMIGAEGRPTRGALLGLLAGFVGAVLLLAPWSADSGCTGSCDDDSAFVLGAVACLVASASYGVSYAYMARYLTPRGLSSLTLAAGQLIAATGLLVLVTPFAGLQPITFTAQATTSLLVLGILGTGLAYVLNFHLIAADGPSIASTVTYLLPTVSIGLGVAFADEELTWPVAVGTAIVLIGLRAHASPSEPEHKGRRIHRMR
jgi:drug/metabolite transporter (DMT)-like permease